MSVRRTVSVLALLVLAGCGGAKAGPSTDGVAEGAPVDPVMEQRLAVPQPRRPPLPARPPSRADGAGYVRYFIAGALEYAMRSGFTGDLRVDALPSARGRVILQRIDDEYATGHHVEMTPIYVEAIRIDRGPFQVDSSGNITHRLDPWGVFYWTVSLKYRVDELSIRDSDGVIATAQDLEFTDQLVVASGTRWRVYDWESRSSDPDAPILAQVPKAAA